MLWQTYHSHFADGVVFGLVTCEFRTVPEAETVSAHNDKPYDAQGHPVDQALLHTEDPSILQMIVVPAIDI